ncbi:MAG: hypothetical protein JO256_08745 [Alphaproteobacteria bacterium]|nr:hypothetical protein [Alphaproteobacteria bacterium]
MKWDIEALKAKTIQERHDLWLNAKRLADTREDAKSLLDLIEHSGLDYNAVKSVRFQFTEKLANECVKSSSLLLAKEPRSRLMKVDFLLWQDSIRF